MACLRTATRPWKPRAAPTGCASWGRAAEPGARGCAPDGSGFDICRELRKADAAIPVIMTFRSTRSMSSWPSRSVRTITTAAADQELVARMAPTCGELGWSRPKPPSRLEFRELVIDVNERAHLQVGRGGRADHTEFDLLTFLTGNAERS
jgi:DNA-binding response OmpR family regulator